MGSPVLGRKWLIPKSCCCCLMLLSVLQSSHTAMRSWMSSIIYTQWVVKGFSRRFVPHNGCFALVRDANTSNTRVFQIKARTLCRFDNFIHASVNGIHDFEWVLLYPPNWLVTLPINLSILPRLWRNQFQRDLVCSHWFACWIVEYNPGRAGSLIDSGQVVVALHFQKWVFAMCCVWFASMDGELLVVGCHEHKQWGLLFGEWCFACNHFFHPRRMLSRLCVRNFTRSQKKREVSFSLFEKALNLVNKGKAQPAPEPMSSIIDIVPATKAPPGIYCDQTTYSSSSPTWKHVPLAWCNIVWILLLIEW